MSVSGILVLLMRVEFIMYWRRIAKKMLLNDFLNAWTIILLYVTRMEHSLESILLLLLMLMLFLQRSLDLLLVVVILVNRDAQTA